MLRVDSPSRLIRIGRHDGRSAPLRTVRGVAPAAGARPRPGGDAVRAAPTPAAVRLRISTVPASGGAGRPDPGPRRPQDPGDGKRVRGERSRPLRLRGRLERGTGIVPVPPHRARSRRAGRSRLPAPPTVEDDEKEHACLDRCLGELAPPERRLLLGYHQGDKSAKIRRRSELASEHGLSPNALRLKIHRLTGRLRECVTECLEPGGMAGAEVAP